MAASTRLFAWLLRAGVFAGDPAARDVQMRIVASGAQCG
jgi:hypothetical protein